MLSEQPFMKFEIREKVNIFKENQSLRQLSSLDLQPIVKVYESENNIEISGYLVLNGEFVREATEEEWEEEYEQADGVHSGSIFSQPVESLNFQHQIPLSIQIQPERVSEVSQVFVEIDFFDYEVLSEDQMELVAHVRLVGVHPYMAQDTPMDILDEDVDYDSSVYEYLTEESSSSSSSSSSSFFSSSSLNVTQEETAEEGKVKEVQVEQQPQEVIAEQVQPKQQEVEPQASKMKIGFKKKEANPNQNQLTGSNPFSSLLKNEKAPAIAEEVVTEEVVTEEVVTEEVEAKPVESTMEQSLRMEIDEMPTGATVSSNPLFSLMRGNEESRKTLKIYFVKQEDSLERIALKYNIKVDSIIQRNKLSSQEIKAGQILYLPIES